MKAVIKNCYSTDIDDLFDYLPEDSTMFGFPLRFVIGPKDELGEESFDVFVCTPAHLLKIYSTNEIVFGRHLLIVQHYDFNNILDVVANYVTSLEEETWEALAGKIGRVGKWEFEDYKPFSSPS